MPVTLLCQWCTQSYRISPSRVIGSKFCSPTCRHQSQTLLQETRECLYCKKPFQFRSTEKAKKERQYCSVTCALKAICAVREGAGLRHFWEHVSRCNHEWICLYCCWPWTEGISQAGYGKFTLHSKTVLAHRKAWELFHGRPLPEDREIAHYCHTPICCNPLHIHPATHKENMGESARDGRYPKGEHHYETKLTNDNVREMFHLHAMGWTGKAIAHFFDTTPSAISRILLRKTWKHVSIPTTK